MSSRIIRPKRLAQFNQKLRELAGEQLKMDLERAARERGRGGETHEPIDRLVRESIKFKLIDPRLGAMLKGSISRMETEFTPMKPPNKDSQLNGPEQAKADAANGDRVTSL